MVEPVVVTEMECMQCGYHWVPRVPNPKVCPRCKHYNWRKSPWEVENGVNSESDKGNKKEDQV